MFRSQIGSLMCHIWIRLVSAKGCYAWLFPSAYRFRLGEQALKYGAVPRLRLAYKGARQPIDGVLVTHHQLLKATPGAYKLKREATNRQAAYSTSLAGFRNPIEIYQGKTLIYHRFSSPQSPLYIQTEY
jgi:hypothetical protein